jgi:hypothetical protein
MGDEYGDDDALSMGIDSSGQPIHHWGSDEVGAVGGVHGVSIGDVDARAHPMGPDGTPLPDVEIPPETHHSSAVGWFEEKLEEAYEAVTHPDPAAHQANPVTEQADHQRHADQEMDDEAAGRHTVNTPERPL